MSKMPPLVAAPVPLPPSTSSLALASHLNDLYATPLSPAATPPLSALSMQHRQLLELQQRYLAASRLAVLGTASGPAPALPPSTPNILPPSQRVGNGVTVVVGGWRVAGCVVHAVNTSSAIQVP